MKENGVCENKTLEYKLALNIGSDAERKEFLADVTSFANADGGYIIFGVEEDTDTKLPTELLGISATNEDELIRKLNSMLETSISPRIPDYECKALPLDSKTFILVVQIGASYIAPHRVTFKGHDKFYSRNSKGKYPMDVDELRSAFTLSQTVYQAIDSYIEERLLVISQNKNREHIGNRPIFVLQFIPVSAFRNNTRYTVKQINSSMNSAQLDSDDGLSFTDKRIVIDGMITGYKLDGHSKMSRRIYLRTNGIIEMSTTDFFFPQYSIGDVLRKPYDVFSSYDMLKCCLSLTDKVKTYCADIGISTPVILSCAILNGRGYSLPRGSGVHRGFREATIDKEILTAPEVLVSDFTEETTKILKPVLDSIWNAFGHFYCTAYDPDTGVYTGLSTNESIF